MPIYVKKELSTSSIAQYCWEFDQRFIPASIICKSSNIGELYYLETHNIQKNFPQLMLHLQFPNFSDVWKSILLKNILQFSYQYSLILILLKCLLGVGFTNLYTDLNTEGSITLQTDSLAYLNLINATSPIVTLSFLKKPISLPHIPPTQRHSLPKCSNKVRVTNKKKR